jgi:hypothetical protein
MLFHQVPSDKHPELIKKDAHKQLGMFLWIDNHADFGAKFWILHFFRKRRVDEADMLCNCPKFIAKVQDSLKLVTSPQVFRFSRIILYHLLAIASCRSHPKQLSTGHAC